MTTTAPHPDTEHAPAPRGPRSVWLVAAAIVVILMLAIAGTAAALTQLTNDPEAKPQPAPVAPAPAPAPKASTAPAPAVSAPVPAVVEPAPTPSTPKDRAAALAIVAFKRHILAGDKARQAGGKVTITPRSSVTVPDSRAFIFAYSEGVHYAEKGLKQTGLVVVRSVAPTSVSLRTDPKTYTVPEVKLRGCLDVSGADAVDRNGKSVVPATRPIYFTTTAVVRYYKQYGGWLVAETNDVASSRTEPC